MFVFSLIGDHVSVLTGVCSTESAANVLACVINRWKVCACVCVRACVRVSRRAVFIIPPSPSLPSAVKVEVEDRRHVFSCVCVLKLS